MYVYTMTQLIRHGKIHQKKEKRKNDRTCKDTEVIFVKLTK